MNTSNPIIRFLSLHNPPVNSILKNSKFYHLSIFDNLSEGVKKIVADMSATFYPPPPPRFLANPQKS